MTNQEKKDLYQEAFAMLEQAQQLLLAAMAKHEQAIKCPTASMGAHACKDRTQYWEPCGDLGRSAQHASRVSE